MAGSPQFPRNRTGGDASRTQDSVAGQLGPVARAVSATPLLEGTLPLWVALALVPDFINSTTINEAAAASHKDALGYTHVQGRISSAAGQVAGFVFATLPEGQRPSRIQYIPVVGPALWIVVQPTGTMALGTGVGAGGTVLLSGSFLADG